MAAASLIADLQAAVETLIQKVDLVKGDPGDIDVTRQLLVLIDPVLRACAKPGAALSATARSQAAGLNDEIKRYSGLDLPGRKADARLLLDRVDWIVHRLPRALELAHHLDAFAHDVLHRVHVDKSATDIDAVAASYNSRPSCDELLKIIASVPYKHDPTGHVATNAKMFEDAMKDAATLMAVHGSLSPSATMFLVHWFELDLGTIIGRAETIRAAPHFVARVKSTQAAMHARCTEAKAMLDAVDGREKKDLVGALRVAAKNLLPSLENLAGIETSLFEYQMDQFEWLADVKTVRDRVREYYSDRALLLQRRMERAFAKKGKIPDAIWKKEYPIVEVKNRVVTAVSSSGPGYIADGAKKIGDDGVKLWPAVVGLAQPVHIKHAVPVRLPSVTIAPVKGAPKLPPKVPTPPKVSKTSKVPTPPKVSKTPKVSKPPSVGDTVETTDGHDYLIKEKTVLDKYTPFHLFQELVNIRKIDTAKLPPEYGDYAETLFELRLNQYYLPLYSGLREAAAASDVPELPPISKIRVEEVKTISSSIDDVKGAGKPSEMDNDTWTALVAGLEEYQKGLDAAAKAASGSGGADPDVV